MGTRHLICLYYNGRVVVAQYGGHDGYPSHTGRQIMDSLSNARYVQRLRANVHLVRHRDPNGDYSSWPGSSIDEKAGISVLDDIAYADGSRPLLHKFELEFASDGGFCEWVYLVDLDTEVLEVYAGVSEHAMSRMRERPVMRGRLAEAGVKQQVLKVAIPFIDLPGDKEELVKACTAGSEEEEEEEGWW
jgi:hypothetical protein